MKKIIIFGIMFLLLMNITLAFSASTGTNKGAKLCAVNDPVCCDGQTYQNSCVSELNDCTEWKKGECGEQGMNPKLKILLLVGAIYVLLSD